MRLAAVLALVWLAGSWPLAGIEETGAVWSSWSGAVTGYVVQPGDSLTGVSARHGVDLVTIARDSGIEPDAWLRPGQRLHLDHRHIVPRVVDDGLIVNVPQRMLFRLADGILQAAYPVGLGRRAWPTPTGPFEVIAREVEPVWDVPPSIQEEMRREGQEVRTRVPPGPDNPLGRYWLGLSLSGVGIHGTNAPASLYQFLSHGCIRLHPEDVAELYGRVRIGMTGRIIYDPVLLARIDGRLYLEAHRDVYRLDPDPVGRLRTVAARVDVMNAIDWSRVADAVGRREGRPVPIGMPAPSP